ISYTHAYLQETNKGECRGWESLVLPFDVQTITHQKGEIKPFLAYHLTAEDALPDSYLTCRKAFISSTVVRSW
ncbi:MAG: hypothetical protein J6W75_09420, partial [Bacteroidaceae bacterium]|nr:hypothetical protein [Bacteroidaceae bacterium]